MKRVFSILIPFLCVLVFSSCKELAQDYYITLAVVKDNNISIENSGYSSCRAVIHVDKELQCKYCLVPENKTTDFGSVEATSTDPEVIEIKEVNKDKCLITAIAKKEGTAKIRVSTEKYGSSTSIFINVQN